MRAGAEAMVHVISSVFDFILQRGERFRVRREPKWYLRQSQRLRHVPNRAQSLPPDDHFSACWGMRLARPLAGVQGLGAEFEHLASFTSLGTLPGVRVTTCQAASLQSAWQGS